MNNKNAIEVMKGLYKMKKAIASATYLVRKEMHVATKEKIFLTAKLATDLAIQNVTDFVTHLAIEAALGEKL